jgi:hypothetical protein
MASQSALSSASASIVGTLFTHNARACSLTGPAGRDGINGFDGKDGKDGRDGKDGLPGPTGAAGPAGPTGQNGEVPAWQSFSWAVVTHAA